VILSGLASDIIPAAVSRTLGMIRPVQQDKDAGCDLWRDDVSLNPNNVHSLLIDFVFDCATDLRCLEIIQVHLMKDEMFIYFDSM
jgi:hypothetical protein